jgi:putative transposase
MRLKPTPEQSAALLETVEQFTVSFNRVCQTGWRLQEGNAYKLHHATYRSCKDGNTLVSDLHIQARQKASEAVKSAIALQKKGRRVSQPKSTFCPPRFNSRTFAVNWESGIANLSTTQGRQKMPFKLPPYAAYAVGCDTATADLIRKKGKWYLHVVVELPDIEFADNRKAIGVDLGVSRPAVTSDNRFHGKRHWKEVEKRTFRLKRALQANGSKSARRHLRNLAGRQQRFRRDCDHVLSKRILEGVEAGTTVVIENLTDIRKRAKMRHGEQSRRLHAWSFAQLRSFLEYKAENVGVAVTAIDPRHTSQRCNKCGYTSRSNRRNQSDFRCRECGHKCNADLNASKNIRDKHLVGWTTSSSSVPPSIGISSRASVQGQAPPLVGAGN